MEYPMNDLQIRINTFIQSLASNETKASKVVTSLQAFSGMDITHFNKQKTNSVYKYLSTINTITARYPIIKTNDDYQFMSDTDLDSILKCMQQLCLKLLID
jgi:hypothetical protein